MTVEQLMMMLKRLTTEDEAVLKLDVTIEGCDCMASLDGISVIGDEIILRREDGVINTLGDKDAIIRE